MDARWGLLQPLRAASTSAAWPVTLTLRQALAIFPALSIRNVLRSMPIYLRPYIDFSTQVPYFSATACVSSDASGNVSSYFSANFSIGFILSGDTPITSMPMSAELRQRFLERAGFLGAAGRVGLRIEIQHERLAAQRLAG